MLTSGDGVLKVANGAGFAVPAFNISDYAMFAGISDLCEELQAPWIVAIHPDEYDHIGPDLLKAIIARAHRSSVPMAIHLDHGGTYEQVLTSIQSGYTSVMIDASIKPFEENVAITKKVVAAAHAVGLSVEAELGTIGANDSYGESGANEVIYTKPEDAVKFVEATGVDSLAIAIGTFHGLYPAGMKPQLAGAAEGDQGPAAHAAGTARQLQQPDDEIGIAARTGINKINISSDIKVAYHPRCARCSVMIPSCVSR